jgi:hypothetical protein
VDGRWKLLANCTPEEIEMAKHPKDLIPWGPFSVNATPEELERIKHPRQVPPGGCFVEIRNMDDNRVEEHGEDDWLLDILEDDLLGNS